MLCACHFKATLDLNYLSPIGSKDTSWAREGPKNGIKAPGPGALGGAKHNGKSTEPTETKRETAFDQLVLPDGHKEIVVSLIAQYFQDRDSRKTDTEETDIVRGKGKIHMNHGLTPHYLAFGCCYVLTTTPGIREGFDNSPPRRTRSGQDYHSR